MRKEAVELGCERDSRRIRDWMLRVINTDQNPAYGATAELKKGLLPKGTEHRRVPSIIVKRSFRSIQVSLWLDT